MLRGTSIKTLPENKGDCTYFCKDGSLEDNMLLHFIFVFPNLTLVFGFSHHNCPIFFKRNILNSCMYSPLFSDVLVLPEPHMTIDSKYIDSVDLNVIPSIGLTVLAQLKAQVRYCTITLNNRISANTWFAQLCERSSVLFSGSYQDNPSIKH